MRAVISGDEDLCEGESGGSGASDKSTSASEVFRGLKSLSTEDLEPGIEKRRSRRVFCALRTRSDFKGGHKRSVNAR